MGCLERKRLTMLVELNDYTDEMFYRQIEMDKERALKRFEDRINAARDKVLSGVRIEAVYESFPIESRDSTGLTIGSALFNSDMLLKVLEKSVCVVLYVISEFGYEEIEDAESDNLNKIFVDGWGTSFIEYASDSLDGIIEKESSTKGLYTTHSWSPGQHGIDVRQQAPLFATLRPEEIGVELSKSYMMHPKKSISGIIGIGTDRDAPQMRACDYCDLRDTCPSAYA